MALLFGILNKLILYGIVISLIGILGFISIPEVTGDDGADNDTGSSSRAIVTTIGDYFQVRDTWANAEHDGLYGDGDPGDGYSFYLNNVYNNFEIDLKNIMPGDYMRYINTTLISSDTSKVIVTDKYYNRTFVNGGDTDWYRYDIQLGTSGAYGDTYELRLDVEMIIYYAAGPPVRQTGQFKFELMLRSRIQSSGSGHSIVATDKFGSGTEPLYTGAQNQILSLKSVSSANSDLQDLTFTLTLPGNFIMFSTAATLEDMYTWVSGDNPLWRLDSAGSHDLAAGTYDGTMVVQYHISSTTITEMQIPITISIVNTMIVGLINQIPSSNIGTMSLGRYVSNDDIFQGTTKKTFSVPFRNDGNIELKDVFVELYTDNAAFFYKSGFYYDESNNAVKKSFSSKFELGTMAIGQQLTADFSTDVIKNLPPGLYKIPIKYTAKYNTGEIFDFDLDETDFHFDIISVRDSMNEGLIPFILVEVLDGDDIDDISEPDMLAQTSTELEVGMKNIRLEVLLTNLENYQLTSVNAEIATGGNSPILELNSDDTTAGEVGSEELDFTMFGANDPTNSNRYLATFYVDVGEGAAPGLHSVPVTITCLDPFNQERTNTIDVNVLINPIPPRCFVSGVTTSIIEQNNNFTLKITVRNSGGSDAKSVKVMFNGSSNLFTAPVYIQGPVNLDKGTDSVFEFSISAGDVMPGMTYTPTVLLAYEDSLGNEFGYDSSTEFAIPLFAKGRNPDLAPQCFITDVTTTEILPNGIFTMTVKVYNSGGLEAKDVRVMFNGTSNLFSASESVQAPKSISTYSEVVFTFTITAGELEEGKTYGSTLMLSYADVLGNGYKFDDDGNSHSVELRAKEEKPAKPEEKSIWDIHLGLAIVIFGILIMISVIFFSFLHYRAGMKKVDIEKMKAEQPPPQPAQVERYAEPIAGPQGEYQEMPPQADGQPAERVDAEVLPPAADPTAQPPPQEQPPQEPYPQQQQPPYPPQQ